MNRIDLADEARVAEGAVRDVAKAFEAPVVRCSARTDENVEDPFRALAELVVRDLIL